MIQRTNFKIYLRSKNLNNFHTKLVVDHVLNRSVMWDVNAINTKNKLNFQTIIRGSIAVRSEDIWV